MKRFIPLDILRGLTVLLMIIVNNPGSWSSIYPPLMHSAWDGCTPTDLVFPFFLFCVGMAMAFSLAKYDGLCKGAMFRIFRRGILIFLLGLLLNAFPFNHFDRLRIFGVLQRIACCYVLGSLLVLWLKRPMRIRLCIVLLLAAYTAVLLIYGDTGAQFTLEGNVSARIDVALFGSAHVYHGFGIPFDPEGPLGILSATCNVLLGWLIGNRIRRNPKKDDARSIAQVFFIGIMALAFSKILSIWVPVNKPLWSASYVFYTVGWACVVLGTVMYMTEIKSWKKVFKPAVIFGSNAITAYFLSELGAMLIGMAGWDHGSLCATQLTSLLYAVAYAAVIFCISLILYRHKIFIRL